MIKWYWLMTVRPKEKVWDLDTRWDLEKQAWGNWWYRLIRGIR